MDHAQALEIQAAERYLLGEMSSGDAEDFELHYFECPPCALAVESGGQFMTNARAVLAERESAPVANRAAGPSRPSFWEALAAWWARPAFAVPAAAAIVLAGVAVYQGLVVIPGMRQPLEAQALPAFQLAGASRGEASVVRVPAGARFISLSADIPPDLQFPRYLCSLSTAGRPVFEVQAPAPAADQPMTILAPTKELRTGNYELAIYGIDAGGRTSGRALSIRFQIQTN